MRDCASYAKAVQACVYYCPDASYMRTMQARINPCLDALMPVVIKTYHQTFSASASPFTGAARGMGVASRGGMAAWRELENSLGAQWEFNGLPVLPLDVRAMDSEGNEVLMR